MVITHNLLVLVVCILGERYVLDEHESLEYFRGTNPDGHCFFHSVIASCIPERTLNDDRDYGIAVHRWAAVQMGRLVEEGILDFSFLADYLGVQGGNVADAIEIAQRDFARPTIQFTLAHLINRPIVYVSRQSLTDDTMLPTVGVYVPDDPYGASCEPVFVGHEHYQSASSLDGGSGHYIVLRRRSVAQTAASDSLARSDINVVSNIGEGLMERSTVSKPIIGNIRSALSVS